MTDLIDRAKAIAELKREASCGDRDYEKGLEIAADILELFPSADAVEVVRCKDCKLWDKYPSSSVFNFHECHAHIGRISTQAFEYCYRGERKEDE